MNPQDYDGKEMQIVAVAPFAKFMFQCFGCGTPFMFKMKATSDKTFTMADWTFCFCLKPSPCPCAPCCGVGPCAQAPKYVRDPADSTKFVGTGDSICAGGCCAVMFHNKGDVIVWSADKPGTKEAATQFYAGKSPAYPPCLQGVYMADAYFTTKGGVPASNEMER